MPKLTWTAQGRDMARALIDPEVSVGRGDGNAIQILDPSISRNHAIFKFTPDGYVLNDLNSFNG
ncbi:FHA domain-containing protein, partial [bacterium]|nr:FHA domain-containing protein [bacterium]